MHKAPQHSSMITCKLLYFLLSSTDTQSDPNFCIVARVEAFIAGWGLDEALKRSEAYLNAGADAILMHSKKSDPSDIESFVKAWNNQVSFSKYYFVIIFHTLSRITISW